MNIISKNNLRPNGSSQNGKSRPKRGLSIRRVDDYLRFVVFLALIGVVYIWNSYYAERQIKEMDALEHSVQNLKARYLLKQSTHSAGTRLTRVESLVDTIGLRKMNQPAFRLVQGKDLDELEPIDPNVAEQHLRRQMEEKR